MMAETAASTNNKAIIFEGQPLSDGRELASLKGRVTSKADSLRKRGRISDRQAERKGLAPKNAS